MSENYLPAGKWIIFANGFQGELIIRFVDSSRFTGTAFGDAIEGIWQEGAVKLSFLRSRVNQIYHGHLAFPPRGGPAAATYSLAGSFDELTGTYGWFAQQAVIP